MLVVIALAIALSAPAAARAGNFADPSARVFTLASHAEVSAIAALTGGDVVYALTGDPPDGRPGRLMRVTADGRRYTVRRDGARLLAAEGEHSVLRIPQEGSSVERVDTLTGEVSRLPALPRAAAVDALTALADGTAILATNQGVFAITPDERVMKLRAVASVDFPQWAWLRLADRGSPSLEPAVWSRWMRWEHEKSSPQGRSAHRLPRPGTVAYSRRRSSRSRRPTDARTCQRVPYACARPPLPAVTGTARTP